MRSRDLREPRPSYFDRLARRHPEVAEVTEPAAPPRRPPTSPLGRHRAFATAFATTLALAGIAGATALAVRFAGGAAGSAVPAPPPPAAAATAPALEPVWVPVRIEVVDDPRAVPPASSDEDVDAPVSLDTDVPELPSPARPAGHSATATALAGVGAGRGYERPVKVFSPAPEYPPSVARDGRGGVVLLALRVDESGAVEAVDVRRSVDAALDAAAVEAVRRWLFMPARLEGRAVPATLQTAVNFVPPALPPEPPALPPGPPASASPVPEPAVATSPPPELAPPAPDAAPPPTVEPKVAAKPPAKPTAAGETRPAIRLVSPLPTYPAGAWASGRAGDVTLDVAISAEGRVDEVRLVAGLGPPIDTAAINAVRRWRFAPALANGATVPSTQRYSLRFAPQVAALEPPER